MKALRKILVAVKNPDARRQAGVDKAIGIAKSLGAAVELFHAISTPVFMDLQPLKGNSLAALKREALELRGRRLERIAAKARRRGVATTCRVEWDFPPHEAIVRGARRSGADLIVAECHVGRRLAPWLVHLTDWELLRLSPLPVLLLKNARPWHRPRVVAAVDPTHARDKPARLDDSIVESAKHLARQLRGTLDVVHANFPPALGLLYADPSIDGRVMATILDRQKQQDARRFAAFAERADVPRASRHLVEGNPVESIPAFARRRRADLVVMGAVSRSGLKRVFIGNTAESVLADLPCDVLVVKPGRLPSRVPRASRGMRIVPPQPLMPPPV
jgi:universal stress protein E